MMNFYYKKRTMSKIFRKNIFLILILSVLMGCQSLKEGLEGNKKSKNAEEFLINKKNPLVLPPDFSKLPSPKNEKEDDLPANGFEIEDILKKGTSKSNNQTKFKSGSSLEKSIIERIKKN